jgi:ATPase family associated with various cellular activities (AAA)
VPTNENSAGFVRLTPVPGRRLAGDARPQLADVGKLSRRLMRQVVSAARAEESSPQHVLAAHLGPAAAALPVAKASWRGYDHVNVQAGLDAWLAEPGREHKIVGLVGSQYQGAGLSDLSQPADWLDVRTGGVTTAARSCGTGGATRLCTQWALYLVTDAAGPVALMMQGPEEANPLERVIIEAACDDLERGQRVVEEIRRLSVEHNVYRGHVIAFGTEVFGHGTAYLRFLDRPEVGRDQVILPAAVLGDIEEQVLGVARHAGRLLASGQHLKRGVLLHGAPGTGKTHTIGYLLGQLPGVTVVVISGTVLELVAEACSVARTLQPSVVVVEDVDLIAEQRGAGPIGAHPLLFQLLNEMDGLGADLDVTFLLTTNRPDLLEPALAQRPGRVDHAALLPLPDAAARRRLLRLYQGSLELDLADPDAVITRTEGVTASFIKELLRRAALRAAREAPAADGTEGAGPLRVTDAHLSTALDQLLDTRNQLTRVLLGGQREPAPAHDASLGVPGA